MVLVLIKQKKELKDNFKVIDNVISDKHVKVLLKMNTVLKKVKYQFNNIVLSDLEPFSKSRAVTYCCCIYKLSKISGKYHPDISEKEYQKCLNDCVVFCEGTDRINEVLDRVVSFKGEPK